MNLKTFSQTFAILFALFFVCSMNTQTLALNSQKSKSIKKAAPAIVEEPIKQTPKGITVSNPNQRIAHYNDFGKIAYDIPRTTIKNYLMSSMNLDDRMYEIKNISIQKISNNYEFVIDGITEISNNGFVISIPVEMNNNNFYLISTNVGKEFVVRGGIGKGCQKIKLSNNDCGCGDSDWLGEGFIGESKYFAFKTSLSKFEIKLLNCSLDYGRFCSLINSNITSLN